MGLRSEQILLQTLTGAGAGTVNGNWFDLSDFISGAFYLDVTAITAGSITITPQTSVDGTNSAGGLVSSELAAPGAVTAVGWTRYPLLIPASLPFVRISSAIVTGPVSAMVYFVGRT